MKKTILVAPLVAMLIYGLLNWDDNIVPTILMDAEYLANTKKRIKDNDPKLKPAFDQLMKEADAALLKGPYSVTDKTKLPPSQDKHDYAIGGQIRINLTDYRILDVMVKPIRKAKA